MTNIFTLMNPISSATEKLLSQINRICIAQGIPFLLQVQRLVKFCSIMYTAEVLVAEPVILILPFCG